MELRCVFTPEGGRPPREILVRIGLPVRGPDSWVSRVEIVGFDIPHAIDVHGADWAQAIELSAMGLPHALSLLVHAAGGGTVEPPFYERAAPFDPSKYPPEVLAVLGLAPDGSPLKKT